VFYKHLLNEGAGENYGVDFTLEHPLDKGFYMLFTGSLYKSIYKAYDKKWRNTAWNGSYMSSLLAGKEFIFNNKSILHFDINLNYSGGRRYIPIDKQASVLAGEAVYDQKHVYEYQLPAYFRTDLKISYKISGKKITQEWQLDLRNVFDRKNIFSQRYNKKKNDIEYTYQTGFLPVMQYRILF
jgi:outer membrane receptor for monomeric catechols